MNTDTNEQQTGTTPLGFTTTEIDRGVEDFITSIQSEFKTAELEAIPDEGAGPQGAGGDTEAKLAPDAAGGQGSPQPVSPGEAPGSEVGAKPAPDIAREVALATREQALVAGEKNRAELEARVKELEARQVPADLVGALHNAPGATLRAMGLDPDNFVKLYLAEKMGDKAPPALRDSIRTTAQDQKIARLEQELTNYQRTQQAQAYIARVEAGAREHVTKLGDSKDAPTVAKVAKANPDRVTREIMDEIRADAREKMGRDPNGQPLSYEEAARRVEARWADVALAVSGPGASTVAAATPVEKQEDKTKSNQPKPTPTPKKPLAPWLAANQADVESAGVREALAEYKRIEAGIRKG